MLTYEFYLNDGIEMFHLLGILYERRKDPIRISYKSIMNWGKLIVGHYVDINDMYFIEIEVQEGTLTRSTALSPALKGGDGKRRSRSTLSKPQHICQGVEALT
jgi:hypothetical protein